MLKIKTATIEDGLDLFRLLDKINSKEDRYHLYLDMNKKEMVKRMRKNIVEGRMLLFMYDEKIVGFLEYEIREINKNKIVWISSLYTKDEYRKYYKEHVLTAFLFLKNFYGFPIHFTVRPTNKRMLALAKFIGGLYVSEYVDGRIEYSVPKED